MTMSLSSALFADDTMIPTRSTCDGEDVSPPLTWDGVPSGAAELALTMEDPDAPGGTFVHWVLWDIPASTHELDEGVVPDGLCQGTNGFGKTAYGGPCPPKGDKAHRYAFTIYALSSRVSLAEGASIDDLRSMIDGNVLAQARLVGRYGR
jgi:Raf kinase inhibitor-like YbhB/YbcL family protein